MHVELHTADTVLTACLQGEIDHHAARSARETIDTAVERSRPTTLRLDLSALTFMDSSGIGLIMGRYRLMQLLGGNLQLINVPSDIERLIQLAGLYKLPIRNTQETVKEKG